MRLGPAIAHLCETLSLVATHDNYKEPCDCFCGQKPIVAPVIHERYLDFVRKAVEEKIAREQTTVFSNRKETHGQQADQEQTERETA